MEQATASATAAKAGDDLGTGSKTIADLLPLAARRYGDAPAVMYKEESGAWVKRSFEQLLEVSRSLSLGLIGLGIEAGDKVAILANTRPEWTYFDFAALCAGATVVPVYQTNSPEECRYVLEHSDAKAVIVEDSEQLEKIREVRDQVPKLEQVIRMTGSSEDAISFEELVARGAEVDESRFEER
ncbi:MAG: AMP-binding protein, partial [Solirubrobacterales bacterium]